MARTEHGDVRAISGPRTLLIAVTAASLAILPVFLVGTMAVFIREDLPFSAAALGGAVAVFFAAAAVTSLRGGRMVEHLGWSRGLAWGSLGTTLSLLGLGLLSPSWWGIAAWLIVGGGALAVTQPAANLALAQGVLVGRQGVAFGIKQSSIPIGTLLAGLAVPILGETIGWRGAFLVSAVLSAVFAVFAATRPAAPRSVSTASRMLTGKLRIHALVLFSVAAGFGMTAGNSLGAFYVESAVLHGSSPGLAGVVLAAGSAAAVLARVVLGWYVDRHLQRDLGLVSGLMFVGAIGFAVLAFSEGPLMYVGTAVAFIAGWGWSGLLVYSIVRHNAAAPAAASGIFLSGVHIGGSTGPLVFGAIIDVLSYAAAWMSSSVVLVTGAVLVVRGRRALERAEAAAPCHQNDP